MEDQKEEEGRNGGIGNRGESNGSSERRKRLSAGR